MPKQTTCQSSNNDHIDEIYMHAGTDRCYRLDDSLNCTKTNGLVQVTNAHSVHKATIEKHLGLELKTFGIPPTKRLSKVLGSGERIWKESSKTASTGRWSCNRHDADFALIDTDTPDIENPMVPLLFALRATLHETWYADRAFYIRSALGRYNDVQKATKSCQNCRGGDECEYVRLSKIWRAKARQAQRRWNLVRPLADRMVIQLLAEEYDSIKCKKVHVPGVPTTIGTSVELTRIGSLLVMTVIPTQHGHDIIWCWSKGARGWFESKLTDVTTKWDCRKFITSMFLRNPYNIYVSASYYERALEEHEDEIVAAMTKRPKMRCFLSTANPKCSILG